MVSRDSHRTGDFDIKLSLLKHVRDEKQSHTSTRVSQRMRKMHSSVGPDQQRITVFFPIMNKLERFVRQNEDLRNALKSFMDKSNSSTEDRVQVTRPIMHTEASQTNFLTKLLESSHRKCDNKKSGNRYDETLKLFGTYLFTIGGKMLYETLYAKLPIPSLSTISRTIGYSRTIGSVCDIQEGVCRAKDLKAFLVTRGLPLMIWISEDATRITGRIQYDTRSNQLVGFVLPLNNNGMPVTGSYPASSAAKIQDSFQSGVVASLAYVFITQPLIVNAPSFCLSLFGTNNKFYATDVVKRWKYIIECLRSEGISVLRVSSDGDPRLLKAMRSESKLGKDNDFYKDLTEKNVQAPYFHAEFEPDIIPIQDTVHIGAKLRSRLLKPSIFLPMGDFIISASHLKILTNTVSKDKHCLNSKELSPKDKMNYQSVEKNSDPKVTVLLEKHIPGSEATVLYLRIIHLFVRAFLTKDMEPLKRIYNTWYCVFGLRLWRAWLLHTKQYSISDNFLSLNTYVCMEINAHGLVTLIVKLIKISSDSYDYSKMFLPTLFSSQPCESFFRLLRSMTTTYSTIVNTSLLETIYRVKRIQLQDDISSGHLNKNTNEFEYPRAKRPNLSTRAVFSLPDINSICQIIEKAKQEAFEKVQSLGMTIDISECDKFALKRAEIVDEASECDVEHVTNQVTNNPNQGSHSSDDRFEDEFDANTRNDLLQDLNILSTAQESIELKKYDKLKIKLPEKSPFVVVKDRQENEFVVRKSSICWLLNKGSCQISSDRLKRVKDSEISCQTNIRKSQVEKQENKCFTKKCDEICIGDWCLF